MNKFFLLFFPLFLFAVPVIFPFTVELKKDQSAYFDVYYSERTYSFKFRWTLYINDILTVHYRYDNFPRQVELYNTPPLNAFKVPIAKIPENYPYFYVEFKNFNGTIATFDIYLLNDRKNVKVDYKGKKWDILK